MSLADRLLDYPAADEPKITQRTEFDGSAGFIQTSATPADDGPPEYDELLRKFGYDPAQVRIVGAPRVSRWEVPYRPVEGSDEKGKPILGELTTRWLASYRFHIAAAAGATGDGATDLEAIVKAARGRRRATTDRRDDPRPPHWFVVQAGDLQLGKRSRDGDTTQIVERFVQSVETAAADLRECRRRNAVAGVQVSFPGDCIEGNVSQGGRNVWLTRETVTEQTRAFRRLLMFAAETFAPLAERVWIDVVNGNHDEAQRQTNSYPGDGWATEAAIAVSDALTLNPAAFEHVGVRVPEKWSGYMTVPVGDSVVTVAHGHQWRRDKAFAWWANQAIGNHAPAGAQILQHGHWHEWMVRSNADRTVVCSPTFDCGSDWFRETEGGTSRRGAVTYLLRAGEISRMGIA
ncbi:exonuclease [Mycobacterium phage DS6A]|uniref:Exonuclease n=1 Tax=Mycobacterium phage DS6A TaxID=45764 RepID=G8I4E6_9CAUD|nr:exonuclease [Mycobacterium phage DS6A]AER47590.1 hypothetical protein DS6A_36 [Mycobacterium phage DS6A]